MHKILYTQYRRWAACCWQVECSAGREHHGALTACVKRTAEECAGEEALLLAVDALSQAAQSLDQVWLELLMDVAPAAGKHQARGVAPWGHAAAGLAVKPCF